MDIDPTSPAMIPAEAYEAAFSIAEHRLEMAADSIMKKWRLKKEAQRVLKEAELWPLSRCVESLPFVGHVDGHTSGLSDDGTLRFALAVIWLAPFPAHYVSLDFRCEILVPDNPVNGHRAVVYSVKNHKVVDAKPNGQIEYLDAGSIKVVPFELTPDSSVTADELGPAAPGAQQTRFGRTVRIKSMRITAHAPWKSVRDTDDLAADYSFWVPRY